jgi:TRAP-type C4-dicarboxylate transport system substrate-binding protein
LRRKRMKRNWCVVSVAMAALFAAVILAVPSDSFAQKKPVVLRLVVPTPPNDYPLGVSLEEMAKRFNQKARGEYKMEIHAGGALAKMPEYFDAIRVGAVEMGSVGWTIFSFLDPRLGVIEAPFLFNNNDAANYAIKGLLPLYDQLLQEKFNAKGLGLFAFTASEMIMTKPVKSLEEMKGHLVGAISPVASAMAKDLGASPVTIMWPDLYESLQKKVVTGTVCNIHAAKVMNLFDVCKFATVAFGPVSYQGLSINLDVWKKMPPHIQKILQEEADASNTQLGKTFSKLVADEVKECTQKGVTFYFLPNAERERWVKATAAYRDKQLTGFGDFGAKVKQIADEANKKFPYKEGRQ